MSLMIMQSEDEIKKRLGAVKSSGSKIEVKLAKALWHKGFRYRKNDKAVFGNPDIVFRKNKVAIFVDSEFWHGKNWKIHNHNFKSNIEYWIEKIERNIQRDEMVNQVLQKEGWKILRFWGEEIEKRLPECIEKIEKIMKEKRNLSEIC